MGGQAFNVETRKASIRVMFTWEGKQRKETLKIPPTPQNVRYAEQLAARVRRAIDLGVFDYGEFFPESKHAKATSAGLTLSQACENYLEACGGLASKTKRQYRNALAVWQRILGEGRPLVSIKHSEIARAVGTQFRSAKLANNYLIPLRGAFEMASRDLKFESPLDGVKNRKHQAPQPDPLTPAEVEKVLAHMEKHEDERVVRYFRFMFSTGLRPEEAIALQWRDVDWQALTIRVERALSDGVIGPIKTYSARDVDLNSVALAQLEGMKKWSENSGSEIFQYPATGGPWISERWQRVRHWVPALKAAGVRHRRAYQTRHTFATTALMAGANPAYIARQLGHTNAQMLFKTYSKWIDGADRGREKEKVEAALSGGPLSQNYPK